MAVIDTATLHEETLRRPAGETVARLVDILGARLVAVIGDVKQTRTVREWIEGQEPQGNRLPILRFALQVAEAIKQRFGEETAQSWFQGLNHHLLDRAPALVLRGANNAQLDIVLSEEKSVLDALRNFLER